MDNALLHEMITELQLEVRHDYKTGGPLAWRCVSGQPKEGDRVLVDGEIVAYKAEEHAGIGLQSIYISDRVARLERITALTDAYMDATGKEPEPIAIERLTDLVLYEELTDTNKNKMKSEYPIMSERMETTRKNGERSGKLAEEYDQNGRNRAEPKRRSLSTYESIFVDARAKSLNKQRRKRYNDFINGRTDGQFTVNIATGERVEHTGA